MPKAGWVRSAGGSGGDMGLGTSVLSLSCYSVQYAILVQVKSWAFGRTGLGTLRRLGAWALQGLDWAASPVLALDAAGALAV